MVYKLYIILVRLCFESLCSLEILMNRISFSVRVLGRAGIFVPDIPNIRIWLALMNWCRTILLGAWRIVNVRSRMKDMKTMSEKNELSVDSIRCKLNSVERDVNSRMNSFISWWELGVLGPYAKVILFCIFRFSTIAETRKLGCYNDTVDSLYNRAHRGNHI